jgi:hypothetical protein
MGMLQRNYRDAEIYLIRFQQCLTRAMTLIKMYFVSLVRDLGANVSGKILGQVCCHSFKDIVLGRLTERYGYVGTFRTRPRRPTLCQILLRLVISKSAAVRT